MTASPPERTADGAAATANTSRGARVVRVLNPVLSAVGLVACLVCGLLYEPPTLWGLLPILLFAALVVLGMNMLPASVVSTVGGLLILMPGPGAMADIAVASLGNQVTLIGVIIMFGAAVGEVMRRTRVADVIVGGIVGLVGGRGPLVTAFAVMVACLALVASLGTLAGALAIAAPLVIPVAARLGYTRSATAAMMFIGGCAGLALAPFAGSNVAIMTAADAGYLEYLLYGALPLTAVSLVVGLPVVRWMQRRTEGTGDEYGEADMVQGLDRPDRRARTATALFSVVLAGSVVWAVASGVGILFPLVALPVLGLLTGLVGGLGPVGTLRALGTGARSMIGMLVLFVLLAVLFVVLDSLQPFDVILELYGERLEGLGPFLFAIAIALLGWVGVPGATAAQVVLIDELFGGLASSIGIGVATWIIVLLFASKADTYGPFPNANMVGAMGMARSTNLKNVLITGWAVLIPVCAVYTLIMFIETR
ncbi:Na+/H+ antiporter NhaC family protein [Nocardiopsis changdeensis]|uniref:Citrate transporter-like domain-containing protein n=1 Tax=Nocardiopsis changdeensis TaxID=2831969 RepID=A0ABX8BFZ1_9ACTN|nr:MULTISPECIES: SLC13 family permease [Nocardiopsis]QUX21155.1 hypothetical protein KGD84_22285 [Nocardiopsis changdeensis]QYX37085.1 hypothetical protein K1J57_31740 [Nocardiopsis sp. MT53]